MITTCRLSTRIERLTWLPSAKPLGAPFAAGSMLLIALIVLTDAMPPAAADQPSAKPSPASEQDEPVDTQTVTLRGRCVDHHDDSC